MMRSLTSVLMLACLFLGCAAPRVAVLEDPLAPEEHLKLGAAYEKNGEYDLAVREYVRAAKRIPLAHLFAGNVCFLKKDYDSAEKHFRRAIEKLPDDPRPLNNLAWLYYTQNKKLDEAETLARRALKLAAGDPDASYRDTLEHILRAKAEKLEPVLTR